MRLTTVIVTDKGHNPAVADLTLNKAYQAVHSEIDNKLVGGKCAYYVLVDDVGDLCGVCANYLGVAIQEVS